MSELLDRLIEEQGVETVNKLMTEHLLITISKALKLDEVVARIEEGNATIEEIRNLIFGSDEDV